MAAMQDAGSLDPETTAGSGWPTARPCRCGDAFCQWCSVWVAKRNQAKCLAGMKRLGVTGATQHTFTVDQARFPDRYHLTSQKVVSRFMDYFWSRMSRGFRKLYPKPVYWCFSEFHDGKRLADPSKATWYLHQHVLVPGVSASGRLAPDLLLELREYAVRLSGIWWYGPRDAKRAIVEAVETVSGYASKAIVYAGKGGGRFPAELLDRKRFDPMSVSRAVSRLDPENLKRVERAERRAVREWDRLAECTSRIKAALAARDYGEAKRLRFVRDHGHPPESPPPVRRTIGKMRTKGERLQACGNRVNVFDGGVFMGSLDVPYDRLCGAYVRACDASGVGSPGAAPRSFSCGWGRLAELFAAAGGSTESLPRNLLAERFAAGGGPVNSKISAGGVGSAECVVSPGASSASPGEVDFLIDGSARRVLHRSRLRGSECQGWLFSRLSGGVAGSAWAMGGGVRRGRARAPRSGAGVPRRSTLVKESASVELGKAPSRAPPG